MSNKYASRKLSDEPTKDYDRKYFVNNIYKNVTNKYLYKILINTFMDLIGISFLISLIRETNIKDLL